VRSAAKLERIAAGVMTVVTGIPRFDGNEKGQDERAILPQETDSKRASFRRRQISTGQGFWIEME
jgi:hypothetical protein